VGELPRVTPSVDAPWEAPPGWCPGIEIGTYQSFANSGGKAAAAWSATETFGGPLAVC
jgi:hypothetical protein